MTAPYYAICQYDTSEDEYLIVALANKDLFPHLVQITAVPEEFTHLFPHHSKWQLMNTFDTMEFMEAFNERSEEYGFNIRKLFMLLKRLQPLVTKQDTDDLLSNEDQWRNFSTLFDDTGKVLSTDDSNLYDSVNDMEESYVSGDGGYSADSIDVVEAIELTAEDFILPRNMSKSLASEVEVHDDDEEDKDGGDQGYIDRLRTLAGMNKI